MYSFAELVEIVARLRERCPWDREQTHHSLKQYLVEETYEVLEAIDRPDMHKLCEELGDLLLQILLHAAIAREEGHFGIDEVVSGLAAKMIRRHPHVFDGEEAAGSHEVALHWEEIKARERGDRGAGEGSVLDGIPRHLPALLRAYKAQSKASRVGFDWPRAEDTLDKVKEEVEELRRAFGAGDDNRIREEMGDLFFALVNVARFLRVEPEGALSAAVDKFTRRFHYIEGRAREMGLALERMTLEEMDRLWEEAKASL